MSTVNSIRLVIILGLISISIAFQNCDPGHGEGSDNFSSVLLGSPQCDPIITEGFRSYHAALSSQALCLNCHVQGGEGNGAFADPDISIALPKFFEKSEELVYQFATSPAHRAGFTGPQNVDILAQPKAEFEEAETRWVQCLQQEGQNNNIGGGVATPNILTRALAIPADATNAQVIQFDLGSMAVASNNVPGVQFEITVQSYETATGVTGYDISLPRIIAGNTTVYVKNLAVHLNGQPVPNPAGSTFQNVDRYVAPNTTRPLYESGAMRVIYDIEGNNTIAIAFERIQLAPDVNFSPATFANLTAANNQNGTIRVFALRCAGCHSGANPTGGFTITANDYALLYLNGMFRPYDLSSRLWTVVENNTMPPGAPLPDNEKEFIRGWILDGARRN